MNFISRMLAAAIIFFGHTALADENFATIYNRNLGLIRQIRTIELSGPDQPVQFTDVAAKLIPASVHLRLLSESGDFQVLEQNFQFDLESPDKILEKYIDHPIEIVKENGDLITGTLLRKRNRSLVIQTETGMKLLWWNDKMSINVNLLSEGLTTKPTLICRLAGVSKGKESVEISYLTAGMSWQAEYVGILGDSAGHIDLEAWASVTNRSGLDIEDATLRLVAGDVHRVQRPRVAAAELAAMGDSRNMTARKPVSEKRDLFEYHVYEPDRRTTLKNNRVKQIALFPPARTRCEKEFSYDARRDPKNVAVRLLIPNNEKAGLGKPMPAGLFRIYRKDGERLEFIGEDRIERISRNDTIKITMGTAFDLSGERKIVAHKKVSDRAARRTVEIELGNNKKTEPVTIIVREYLNDGFWEIEAATAPYEKTDAQHVEFSIPVAADQKKRLRYTVLMKW